MRRQPRRKQRRLVGVRIKVVACGHRVSVYPDHGQNHPRLAAPNETPAAAIAPKKAANEAGAKAAPKAGEADAEKPAEDQSPGPPAEVHEAFSRFRKANPEPKGELEHLNPYTLLVAVVLSAQATDAGVNKATRALFAVADTPQKMLALGEETGARLHQDHRALSQQGEERHRAVGKADRRIRRRGAAHPRRDRDRCPAPGARPPMSCSTWPWRTHHGGRHPCVPRRQPHRPGAGQERRSRSSWDWRR